MYKNRQTYHAQIRNNQRKKTSREDKIATLCNFAYLPLIDNVPNSLNQICDKLLNNQRDIVPFLKQNIEKIFFKIGDSNYYQWSCLNLICNEIAIEYQEEAISKLILNDIISRGKKMMHSYEKSEIIIPLLKIVFLNLKYLNQITYDNSNFINSIIAAQLGLQMRSLSNEDWQEGFKISLDILHRALFIVIQKEILSQSQMLAIIRLVQETLISKEENITSLSVNCRKGDSTVAEEILDILINITFIYDKEKLCSMVTRLQIDKISEFFLQKKVSPRIQRKTIHFMMNCIVIIPSLGNKLKDAGIPGLLLRHMDQCPKLVPNILQFLDVYLIDIQDNRLVVHFMQIQGVSKLLIILDGLYQELQSDSVRIAIRIVNFLLNQEQTAQYYSRDYLRILGKIINDTCDQEIQQVCEQSMNFLRMRSKNDLQYNFL